MAADNRFLDDLARVAGGAVSLLSTVRRQIRSDLKERVGAYSSRMADDNDNSEIERLQASISKYRVEQEDMKKRIAELEASLSGKSASKAKPVSSKAKTTKNTKSKRK